MLQNNSIFPQFELLLIHC